MPKITANDADFYYELCGQGEPLIIIPGYAADHTGWAPMVKKLSKHFQVLVFDNRASGQTTDRAPVLSTALMAQDVIALAKTLGLVKPHIIGHSMGGTIAQHLASHYPQAINKLVILTSSAKWRLAMLTAFKSSLDLRVKNVDFDLIFTTVLPWLFGESFLQNTENVSFCKQLMLNNPYPQSLADQTRQFRILETFDGRAQLHNIIAPTLVAYAKEDIIALPEESHYMLSQIPHAQGVEFACAHMVPAELPEQLATVLIKFLLT